VVGASGGVGVYAVQIAKALGAEVTAVASGDKADVLRDLGADHVLDYRRDDITAGCRLYDLVFDTVGATRYPRMMRALKRRGLYLPLNFGGRELWHSLLAVLIRGPRIKIHVNGDSAERLRDVLEMLSKGRLRPVIDRVFALEQIRAAHSYVEARHRRGAVVVKVASARALRSAA
jgi:NADPH:quinone reductase-like Zn-dependent oxidoreductase